MMGRYPALQVRYGSPLFWGVTYIPADCLVNSPDPRVWQGPFSVCLTELVLSVLTLWEKALCLLKAEMSAFRGSVLQGSVQLTAAMAAC